MLAEDIHYKAYIVRCYLLYHADKQYISFQKTSVNTNTMILQPTYPTDKAQVHVPANTRNLQH